MVISTIARGASANPAHAVTVALAIILMVVHAAWAAVVLARENRGAMARFHRFSVAVRTIATMPTTARSAKIKTDAAAVYAR